MGKSNGAEPVSGFGPTRSHERPDRVGPPRADAHDSPVGVWAPLIHGQTGHGFVVPRNHGAGPILTLFVPELCAYLSLEDEFAGKNGLWLMMM